MIREAGKTRWGAEMKEQVLDAGRLVSLVENTFPELKPMAAPLIIDNLQNKFTFMKIAVTNYLT